MQDLLLPEQLEIKERLLHAIRYSLQTVVIQGAAGAGKTSIAKQALESLDEYNQAWLQCPQHMSDKELRQKVLFQWHPNAVYDDELTIEQNLQAHPAARLQRHVIFLDDANNLTANQYVELAALTQMELSITLILLWEQAPSYFEIEQQLFFKIDPLAYPQRVKLFEQVHLNANFSFECPAEVLEYRLKNSSGYPADIIELANQAIDNPEAFKQRKGRLITAMLVSIGLIIVLMTAAWFLLNEPAKTQPPSAQFAKPVSATATVANPEADSSVVAEVNSFAKTLGLEAVAAAKADGPAVSEPVAVVPAMPETQAQSLDLSQSTADVPVLSTTPVLEATNEAIIEPAIEASAQNLPQQVQTPIAKLAQLPQTGYTLQLAAVKDLKSLRPLLKQVEAYPNWIVKIEQRNILLVAKTPTRTSANALKSKDKALAKAWIRPWTKLNALEPQLIQTNSDK